MNPFKLLCTEYDAIHGTIDDYTSESNVMNFLLQLKMGIENGDFEIIEYTLSELSTWYGKNMTAIIKNPYVSNLDSHKRNAELIKDILSRLKPEDCVVGSKPETDSLSSNEPLIFISHKSDDKAYGNALRNFIAGLGVPKDRIIYTSHELHKIPLDENIFDYLRKISMPICHDYIVVKQIFGESGLPK